MAEENRSRLAQFAFVTGMVGIALALGGIIGIQVRVLPALAGFYLFALGTLVCGTIAMLTGAVSLVRTRNRLGDDRRRSLTATVIGLVLAGIVLVSAAGGGDAPPINDITTDLANPPAFANANAVPAYADRDMSYPPEFVEVVRQGYPDLAPIQLGAAPGDAYARALASARSLGWEITHENPQAGTFDATETTAIFRFVDDVTVRVTPDQAGSRIDVRSKSRDGRGDLGANADRIERFAAEIRLPAVASGP